MRQIKPEEENKMKKKSTAVIGMVVCFMMMAAGVVWAGSPVYDASTGSRTIFKDKCASCHLNFDNMPNMQSIKNPEKIVDKMRKGGGRMPKFDAKTVSNEDARRLADFIITSFNSPRTNNLCAPMCAQ
jgi:mono/diheme cytochrome c family protein